MNRKQLKTLAKQSLKIPGQRMNIFKMYIPQLVIGIVSFILMMLGGGIDNILGKIIMIVGYIGFLALIPIYCMTMMGIFDMILSNVKYNRLITFEDWLQGKDFKLYWKVIGFGFLANLICGLPGAIPLVGWIVVLALAPKVTFMQMIKMDKPEIGFIDAAKLSFKLTGEFNIKMIIDQIILLLSFFLWYFTIGIPVFGLVWTLPYIQMTWLHYYFARCEELGITDETYNTESQDIETAINAGTAVVGAGAAAAAGAFNKLADKMNKDKAQKEINRPFANLGKKPVMEEDPVPKIYDIMVQSIRNKAVVDIMWKGDEVRALPIDIVNKNGENIYNFFMHTPEGIKPVQVKESEITDIIPNGKYFDPARYVTWRPHWTIDRDWDI